MLIQKRISNDEGVILLTVIMLTIVLSIVAIGIMSVNVSQVKTGQSVVDSIKAEQLAMGVFYLCHQSLSEGAATCPQSIETMDGKTFTFNALDNPPSVGGGPNNTTEYDFEVNY